MRILSDITIVVNTSVVRLRFLQAQLTRLVVDQRDRDTQTLRYVTTSLHRVMLTQIGYVIFTPIMLRIHILPCYYKNIEAIILRG